MALRETWSRECRRVVAVLCSLCVATVGVSEAQAFPEREIENIRLEPVSTGPNGRLALESGVSVGRLPAVTSEFVAGTRYRWWLQGAFGIDDWGEVGMQISGYRDSSLTESGREVRAMRLPNLWLALDRVGGRVHQRYQLRFYFLGGGEAESIRDVAVRPEMDWAGAIGVGEGSLRLLLGAQLRLGWGKDPLLVNGEVNALDQRSRPMGVNSRLSVRGALRASRAGWSWQFGYEMAAYPGLFVEHVGLAVVERELGRDWIARLRLAGAIVPAGALTSSAPVREAVALELGVRVSLDGLWESGRSAGAVVERVTDEPLSQPSVSRTVPVQVRLAGEANQEEVRVWQVVAGEARPVSVDAHGSFQVSVTDRGVGTLVVEADGYRTFEKNLVELVEESSLLVELEPRLPDGQLRVFLRAPRGRVVPVEGHLYRADSPGVLVASFRTSTHSEEAAVDVVPGRYVLELRSDQAEEQRLMTEVEMNGVTVLNVDLQMRAR